MSPLDVLAVAIGGGLGAVLRALTGRLMPAAGGFPLATLTVNIAGSFLLASGTVLLSPDAAGARLFLGAGLCGALTTFSTYALEVAILFREGQRARAILYLCLTPLLCCLASLVAIHLFA
jgi:CrcB protein